MAVVKKRDVFGCGWTEAGDFAGRDRGERTVFSKYKKNCLVYPLYSYADFSHSNQRLTFIITVVTCKWL